MKKRIIVPALLLCFALTACGAQKQADSSASAPTEANTQIAEDAPRIRIIHYDADGNLADRTEYAYDENGVLLKRTVTDDSDAVIREEVYDELGRLMTNVDYENGAVVSSTSYEYENDAQTRPMVTAYCDADGTVNSYRVYERDSYGNMITLTIYDGYDTVADAYTYDYEYDSEGRMLSQTIYGDGSYSREHYELDADGNIVKTTYSYAEGGNLRHDPSDAEKAAVVWTEISESEQSVVNEYDENGDRIRTFGYYEGMPTTSFAYEYDDAGRLVKEISYDANGAITGYWVHEYKS